MIIGGYVPINSEVRTSLENLVREKLLVGKILCIEGNIATGKTTLIKTLVDQLCDMEHPIRFKLLEEKVDEKLLSEYVSNPRENGAKFQRHMMLARMNSMKLADEYKKKGFFVIMDTGLVREYAFSLANYNQKNMTLEEYKQHIQSTHLAHKEIGSPEPDYVFLLDSDPQRCKRNILRRNRVNESEYTIEYLRELREAHISCVNGQLPNTMVKVVLLDCEYADPNDVWDWIFI